MRVPVLELRNVSRYFSDMFSLKNINLSFWGGQVHVLVGENGSGKSCLMKIICGIFQPDEGEILSCGISHCIASVSMARNEGIYYAHQDPCLYENMTVAENVFFDRVAKNRIGVFSYADTIRIYPECKDLFAKYDIPMDPYAKVSELGFSQRQMLETVKAFVSEAKIVILDEPSSTLNLLEREILYKMIRGFVQKGGAVCYISHKLDEIRKIGDVVSVMRGGGIITTVDLSDLEDETFFGLIAGDIRYDRYPKLKFELGEEVLRVEHLSAANYLEDVVFSLRKGEILGVTGLMGSGRSMLANCLFGNIRMSGDVFIRGQKVKINCPQAALECGIALIPEKSLQNAVFDHMDLRDNTTISSLSRFSSDLQIIYKQKLERTVLDYIRTFNIRPGGTNDLITSYSGGNQQKVIVARWIMACLEIYIMDEPTRGVDYASRIDIYNAMNDLVAKGASILFISSEFEEILGMSDRILVLADGKIACDLPREKADKGLLTHYATRSN